MNFSEEAIQKAVLQFLTVLREKGDNITAVGHDNVGLSQERYEAPSYEVDDNVEDLYNFRARRSPPDNIDVPEEFIEEGDDDSISLDDDGVEFDQWDNQDKIKSIADDVMQQNKVQVQSIMEQDDLMQMSGFIKLCCENINEQLDLLEQYSRSGNCDPGRYNLKEKMK